LSSKQFSAAFHSQLQLPIGNLISFIKTWWAGDLENSKLVNHHSLPSVCFTYLAGSPPSG